MAENPRHPRIIRVRGAREHNLRSLDLDIPLERLTVITGVSGSGKSSLAHDVLFREGQRRYLESFSTYARQFLSRLGTPDVEDIRHLPPAVAVRQRRGVAGPRSTVGTLSGIFDLLRLLFARCGTPPGNRPDLVVDRNLFSFNSPRGACPQCRGLGVEDRVDPDLLVADPQRTLRKGALAVTTPAGYLVYSQVTMDVLDQVCRAHGFDVDTPWCDLTAEQRRVVLYGSRRLRIPYGKHPLESRLRWKGITARPRAEGEYRGIVPVIEQILKQKRNRNALRFARTRPCRACEGSRLSPEARSVTFRGRSISELAALTVGELLDYGRARSREGEAPAAEASILDALMRRLNLLVEAGLDYLRLDRGAAGLSGGEYQRIRLCAAIAAGLSGVLYVVDEPSAGMHPRDRGRLLAMLSRLSRRGNTVVLVEHDPAAVEVADCMIDLGPGPGDRGGQVVAAGEPHALLAAAGAGRYTESLTLRHLLAPADLTPPAPDPAAGTFLRLRGVRRHNLEGLDVEFCCGAFNVVTGVSGAGKSTLVSGVLVPAVSARLRGEALPGDLDSLEGTDGFRRIREVDQSPLGRTPRSNPATYTGAFDAIRELYAALPEARERGWDRGRFSFNREGGRCDECQGAGSLQVGMQFMGNVEVVCPVCDGRRFNRETRSLCWRGKGIHQVLELTVDAAAEFFAGREKIERVLKTLQKLGLGYLQLGQSSTTLSGGEAQRVKLAAELSRPAQGKCLYVLDEPSSGLHPHDIRLLLKALFALVEKGHTVIAVEHHPHVIALAHHVVDLGPDGGAAGGRLLFQGHPEDLAACRQSRTAAALRGEISPPPPPPPLETDPWIRFSGVRTHNLKEVDVAFPRYRLTAVTGVSGSGKSSLVADTLLGTGQNRFLESFPAYARRLLLRHHDAEFAAVSGLCPALAPARAGRPGAHSRSTVGTVSRIQPLLRLLFSRFGALPGERPDPLAFPASAFSPNHHAGACPACGGLGWKMVCDPLRLLTDPGRPLLGGALADHPRLNFFSDPGGRHVAVMKAAARELGMNLDGSWRDLETGARRMVMEGTGDRLYRVEWQFQRGKRTGTQKFSSIWAGLCGLVNEEYSRVHGDGRGRALEKLMSRKECTACGGNRLRTASQAVRYGGRTLPELGRLEARELADSLRNCPRGPETPLLERIVAGLDSLVLLGTGYLSLDRGAATLSAGEIQRVRLAGILGATLSGTVIVLDEPSRGLHPADSLRLLEQMRRLIHQGNTVVMVEHDLELVRAADHLLDLGPGGGEHGGRIIAQGTPDQVRACRRSHTAAWLRGDRRIRGTRDGEPAAGWIRVRGARAHNLKEVDVSFPRQRLTAVTGVSGSGKTSLVFAVLAASARTGTPVQCDALEGMDALSGILTPDGAGGVDPRTAPVVVSGLWPLLRDRYAAAEDARAAGLKRRHFDWMSPSGSCRECGGAGRVKVSLDFLNDLWVPCDACGGDRFSPQVLGCRWRGLNPGQILGMTVDRARACFRADARLREPLDRLAAAGLGYLRLGQGGHSLSSGEIQRLLLCAGLKESGDGASRLILLDEPAAGLHPRDARRLIRLLDARVRKGDTVVMITHRPEIAAGADWVVDLGPGAGARGGRVVASGPPRQIAAHPHSLTGRFLGSVPGEDRNSGSSVPEKGAGA